MGFDLFMENEICYTNRLDTYINELMVKHQVWTLKLKNQNHFGTFSLFIGSIVSRSGFVCLLTLFEWTLQM